MVKSTKSTSKRKTKSEVKSIAKEKAKVIIKGVVKNASKSRPNAKVKIVAKINSKMKGMVEHASKKKPKLNSNINPKEIGAAKSSVKSMPNKILAKENKLLFSLGDYVVYPTHGVGRVIDVEVQEIAGHKLKLFVISFDEDRMTLRVPIAKVVTSGLRKLTSRKNMDNALETLKGRARVKRTMWSRRAQEYEAKINSGDPLAIAEVVRDLYRKSGQPEQSFSERQIFESACHRLAMELAAIEKIDIEAATEKMEDLLKAA